MSKFFDEKGLSAHLSIPRRTLQRWRQSGEGPPYVRAGARRIIYSLDAVSVWAASREYRHRAAEMMRQPGGEA
jgi:hypothetical protein